MCDKCKGKFYITTPIYYPSDKLHIGHTYCTVATDAMARYKRLQGYDVCFLTGTDEHGQKIETRAKETGVTPKEFVDHIVEGEKGVKDLWKLMNISYDRFIRTTDSYHVSAIQKIFKEMYEKGDIYKGTYEGMYCTPCELSCPRLSLTAMPYCCMSLSEKSSKLTARYSTEEICFRKVSFTVSNFFCRGCCPVAVRDAFSRSSFI